MINIIFSRLKKNFASYKENLLIRSLQLQLSKVEHIMLNRETHNIYEDPDKINQTLLETLINQLMNEISYAELKGLCCRIFHNPSHYRILEANSLSHSSKYVFLTTRELQVSSIYVKYLSMLSDKKTWKVYKHYGVTRTQGYVSDFIEVEDQRKLFINESIANKEIKIREAIRDASIDFYTLQGDFVRYEKEEIISSFGVEKYMIIDKQYIKLPEYLNNMYLNQES